MQGRRRLLAATLGVFAAVASGVGVTYAAFSKTTSNPGSFVSARPDWRAPTVAATTIAKSPGYLAGYVRRNGTYYLYASVSEPASNPAAGIASVVADPSAITASQTAVPLTAGGPWTVEGVSYNYRSAALTADAGVTAGTKNWSIVATDAAAPTANTTNATGLTGTVDVTAPSATGLASANVGGGTQAKMELGDTITLTTSERLDPESVLSGWAGASTDIVVRVTDGGASANDAVTFWAPGEASQLALGSIDTGRKDYVTTTVRFGLTGTASTMVQSGSSITITLGTASDATGSSGPPVNMTWTPSAGAYDRAGIAMGAAAYVEADDDRDF
jgi:hypothetical protein